MQFYSTNRQCREVSLREAVMTGLAPDGGLFMPERIPVIPGAFFNNIADMTIRDISYVVADIMLGDDIDSADIKRIIDETFTFDIPLQAIDRDIYVLELFHGPTLAFKDVGARFLARVISHYSDGLPNGVKVLVATSGDSGARWPQVSEVFQVWRSMCSIHTEGSPSSNAHSSHCPTRIYILSRYWEHSTIASAWSRRLFSTNPCASA